MVVVVVVVVVVLVSCTLHIYDRQHFNLSRVGSVDVTNVFAQQEIASEEISVERNVESVILPLNGFLRLIDGNKSLFHPDQVSVPYPGIEGVTASDCT